MTQTTPMIHDYTHLTLDLVDGKVTGLPDDFPIKADEEVTVEMVVDRWTRPAGPVSIFSNGKTVEGYRPAETFVDTNPCSEEPLPSFADFLDFFANEDDDDIELLVSTPTTTCSVIVNPSKIHQE